MDQVVVGTVAMDQGVVSAVVVDWIVVGGARQINPSGLILAWSLFQIWRMLEY